MLQQSLTSDLTFNEAFKLWLSHRVIDGGARVNTARYISPKTITDYTVCSRALAKFFHALPLNKIHPGHLMQYQRARATCDLTVAQWAKAAGANCIRKEIALLVRILTEAGCWKEVDEKCLVRLRAEESDVQRAMTPDEQHRFLHVASSREDWRFIYCYVIVALQTTCSTGEMRGLKLGDIFLDQEIVQIRRATAKNKYRIRTIPFESEDVIWALKWLINRARELGSTAMHHYLFPFYEAGSRLYDPTRQMSDSGLKKRWDEVRQAAGLGWLKPNGMRHTAITRLAEAGAPIPVILATAGHVTVRMQQHYTAISLKAQRKWARSAWGEEASPDPVRRKGPVSVRPAPAKMQPMAANGNLFWMSSTSTR